MSNEKINCLGNPANPEEILAEAELLLNQIRDINSLIEDFTPEVYGDLIKEWTIKEIAELQKITQELDSASKAVKAIFYNMFDFVRINVLPARMEEEGYEGGLKITGVGRIKMLSDVRASIPSDSKKDAYDWLSDHGHGDMVVKTVNNSTLKALSLRKIKENDPLPEEFFKIVPYTKTSITKI